MAVVVVRNLLLLGLLGLLATFFNHLDVIVEDGSDDGNHVGLDDTRADVFGAANSDVDDALKGEVPFPHVHHIFAPALLQDADQPLDAAIYGEDVSYAGGRGCEVCEMVERVDQGQGRCAVERTAVVEGRGDAHRRLVDVGDAEIDFPHFVGWCAARGIEKQMQSGRKGDDYRRL